MDHYGRTAAAMRQLNNCQVPTHHLCVSETLVRLVKAADQHRPDLFGDRPGEDDLDAGLALIDSEQHRMQELERDLIEARIDAGGTWSDVARALDLPSGDAARMRYRDQLHGTRTWPAGRPKSIGPETEDVQQD